MQKIQRIEEYTINRKERLITAAGNSDVNGNKLRAIKTASEVLERRKITSSWEYWKCALSTKWR